MRLTVLGTLQEALPAVCQERTVIVLDVLRATTNMVTALEAGALSVLPVRHPAEAIGRRREGCLLAGERECVRIEGFDLGNSPLEFREETVAGKHIIMTTTNGTEAVRLTGPEAAAVLVGCLRNATACAETAAGFGRDIVLVCAGTKGHYSFEDGIGAGLIADRLVRLLGGEAEPDDLAVTLMEAWRQTAPRLTERLLACENGRRLTRLGFAEDVRFCATTDATRVVPLLAGSELIAW
ncbi:putative 2-phosphosulfolactate phosphatase [Paenibacillus sp. J31TS4]|uniref:2-phosphosulfolactate phosphatase n=1 Tax=Paenibacillus sp. J31TS4 TaxID=2807195 RepID=UPI001B114F6A|nr:2-phosphosulfolactate phosphatase [Paenibacillus sp. J31TS4]GIP37620.1 putative 2-phosphosulfolactate phosphatase [Paenibacillus sp. J31TS4]